MATGIYVHIPFCRSRCSYCNFVSSTDFSLQDLYLQSLLCEIRERANGAAVDSVYIGGGTPSVLRKGGLASVFTALREGFAIRPDSEITVEANPDSCNAAFLHECKAVGVNRLSVGLQSAKDVSLQRIGRPHNFSQFVQAVELALSVGIQNISCDIMLGLPGETCEDVRATLRKVADLPVSHLSAYALKAEEGTPLYRSGFVPDDDLQAEMYDITIAACAQMGLRRYEVSNFAAAGRESTHNRKYWQREPYFGFGVAAHSFTGTERQANTEQLSLYNIGRRVREVYPVTLQEAIEETIMLSLRTTEGLSFDKLKQTYGYDLAISKEKELQQLLGQGLLERTENGVRIADAAFYVMNDIIIRLL